MGQLPIICQIWLLGLGVSSRFGLNFLHALLLFISQCIKRLFCSINEYEGRDIPCAPNSEDVSVSVGIADRCPLPGEEVIAGLGIEGLTEGFWFNLGLVIALQLMFRIGAYVLLRRSR